MRTSQKLYLPLKRLIGIFGSLVGIIVCFALLWWWVLPINAIVTKGHPFFVQGRYGKNKKVFKMIKFRSMKMEADPNLAPSDMDASKQASMDTGFGKFLRKTSIDETPQLLNIFIGQMAFIGPRPGSAHNEEFLVECRERYTPNAYDVKPGISGYAQTAMGREHDPEEKAKYDHEYVTKMSLWFDIKIFVYTVLKLFGAVKGR
ncbi:MAG: sugar transferase [Bacilli bacterium]|nr:sugar transferase [Bacilli bacterium]